MELKMIMASVVMLIGSLLLGMMNVWLLFGVGLMIIGNNLFIAVMKDDV